MKVQPKSDAELKAEFIARNGITKCPPVGRIPPPKAEAPPLPRVAKSKPLPVPPPVAEMGEKPVLMWVPIDNLHINDRYQRTISTGRGQSVIREIVTNFRWPLFSVLTVTQREEGGYWVIDGQHRMTAAAAAGIREVPAMLIDHLDTVQQARIFTGLNAKRVSVNVWAIHHALVAAGDPEHTRIRSVCDLAGVKIPKYPKSVNAGLQPDETLAVSTIKTCIKKYGDKKVVDALSEIRRTYPTTAGMLNRDRIIQRLERVAMKETFGDE